MLPSRQMPTTPCQIASVRAWVLCQFMFWGLWFSPSCGIFAPSLPPIKNVSAGHPITRHPNLVTWKFLRPNFPIAIPSQVVQTQCQTQRPFALASPADFFRRRPPIQTPGQTPQITVSPNRHTARCSIQALCQVIESAAPKWLSSVILLFSREASCSPALQPTAQFFYPTSSNMKGAIDTFRKLQRLFVVYIDRHPSSRTGQ